MFCVWPGRGTKYSAWDEPEAGKSIKENIVIGTTK